jgi:hypothetical protein
MEPECSLPCSQEPTIVPILSQMNPVHTFESCFPKINSDIILPWGVGIAQWYSTALRAGWWGGGWCEFRQGLGIFLFTTVFRPALGTTQPPIQWVPGKRPGREADHSSPSSTDVKIAWSCTSTPQYVFMTWFSFKAQVQLYLYLKLFVFFSTKIKTSSVPLYVKSK